jgi:hypothetical protein
LPAPDDLLFTGPQGKRWDAGTFRRLRWVPAIELAAEKFGLIKRPRIHDLRHSHAAWLIAARVPLPAIQRRLGHESITTTVDRYGHLLDALDDEVMAALAWAMDPTALLPAFLAHAGLTDLTEHLPTVPQQRSGSHHSQWEDASDMVQAPATHDGLVFVVTMGGREVPFTDRLHAQDVADQRNDDHAGELETMRADGWSEDKVKRHGAVGPRGTRVLDRRRPGLDADARPPARPLPDGRVHPGMRQEVPRHRRLTGRPSRKPNGRAPAGVQVTSREPDDAVQRGRGPPGAANVRCDGGEGHGFGA